MGYENAPATKLLATHCCCCARPLVDAKSVELGIGPECRKRHGFAEAQEAPNWKEYFEAISSIGLADPSALLFEEALENVRDSVEAGEALEAIWLMGGVETRRVANAAVYKIAALLSSGGDVWETVGALARAVRALGFRKLATIVEERNASIVIRRKVTPGWGNSRGTFVGGEEIVVEAPYSEESLPILRAVPGRRWDKAAKANVFPASSAKPLYAALAKAFPGARAVGPKGAFVLGKAS